VSWWWVKRSVDLGADDAGVHRRPRQAVLATEREEALLEPRSRDHRAGLVGAQHGQQPARSAVARVSSGQGLEGVDVREPRVLRLVEQALERSGLVAGGEVEDRARGRRDRVPSWMVV